MVGKEEWELDKGYSNAFLLNLFFITFFFLLTIFFYFLFLLGYFPIFMPVLTLIMVLASSPMFYFTLKDNWLERRFYSKKIDCEIKTVVLDIERALVENGISFLREPWGKRRPLWLKIFKSGVIGLRLDNEGLYLFLNPPPPLNFEGDTSIYTMVFIGPVEEEDKRIYEILKLIDEVG